MSAAAVALPQETWQPKANPWLIAVVVSLAAFMEVLDTSIANVALPHIAGNLGASNDQSTWVLTSYLVANAIVLPISGWLVTIFGRQRFFMTCLAIFTVEFAALRNRAQPWSSAVLSRVARRGRRRLAADGAGDSRRHFSAGKTRPGVFALRHHSGVRASDRTNFGRLDDGQLLLALDFLYQFASGHRTLCS